MVSSTADSTTTQFQCSGRFLGFLPGKKSPYQYMALVVASTDQKNDDLQGTVQIKLKKSLQRMMYGYLSPQDWIGVIGKGKLDADSGKMKWKAREIVKLSPRQVAQCQAAATEKANKTDISFKKTASKKTAKAKGKPARVLICQKSSCRKRGSMAVSRAVENAIAETGCNVTVKATGCMKRCKAGPNMVMAGEKHTKVTPKGARSLVKKMMPSS